MSHLTQILKAEPGFSARAVHAHNYEAISPVPQIDFMFEYQSNFVRIFFLICTIIALSFSHGCSLIVLSFYVAITALIIFSCLSQSNSPLSSLLLIYDVLFHQEVSLQLGLFPCFSCMMFKLSVERILEFLLGLQQGL